MEVPEGSITEQGLRTNVSVGIQYIESWLRGKGAAPIYNLMEDAATAEISRSQVWQWIHNPNGILNDGRKVTKKLFQKIMAEELEKIKEEVGEQNYQNGRFKEASELFENSSLQEQFEEFLTIPGYEYLN